MSIIRPLTFRALHRGGIRCVSALAKTSTAYIEKLISKAGALATRKGNLAKLVATATKRNAKLHLKEQVQLDHIIRLL